jgi:cytosine/uracil/thiamine/allantoin permease
MLFLNFLPWLMESFRGILLTDYFLVRRRKLKVPDLYRGDSSSIYWYKMGLNWRAVVAFVMGVWPFFRKCSPIPKTGVLLIPT